MLQSLEKIQKGELEINDSIGNWNENFKNTCFGLKKTPASTVVKTFLVLRNSAGNVRAITWRSIVGFILGRASGTTFIW